MDILMITKALCTGIMAVVIVGGAVWFGIILIRTLDEVNDKLSIIVTMLRVSHQVSGRTIPEVKSDANDKEDVQGVDRRQDDGDNAVAY